MPENSVVVSSSEAFGGGTKKSCDLDRGFRQMGQRGLRVFRVFSIQDWQKIWAQHVMMVLVGGERQTGQSKSSPSSNIEASFFSNSGFLETFVSVIFHLHSLDPMVVG